MGVKIGEAKLSRLLFAGDVILVAETLEDMLELLEEVGNVSEDIEMKFERQHKVMIINWKTRLNKQKLQLLKKKKKNGNSRIQKFRVID